MTTIEEYERTIRELRETIRQYDQTALLAKEVNENFAKRNGTLLLENKALNERCDELHGQLVIAQGEISAMSAKLDAVKPREWLPIESAPKDEVTTTEGK